MATTTTVSGEVIEELKQQATEHFWPHARQTNDMFGDNGLKLVSDSKGVWVYDVEGKEWFDTLSGMWLVNIGHGRKEIADAVYKQISELSSPPAYSTTPSTVELSGEIASLYQDKRPLE